MFWNVTQSLLEGFGKTLEIFALTLLLALPLGLLLSFGSMSRFRPVKWLVKTFIWIIRGTPLMLQLIVIYYGPGLVGAWAQALEQSNFLVDWLASWSVFDRFVAVIVAFVINYSCYFSEIYRGGIESISRGQYEAGQVLGMTRTQVFFRVVLLQVVKRIVPPMSNEIIKLDTIDEYNKLFGLKALLSFKALVFFVSLLFGEKHTYMLIRMLLLEM